MTVSKGFGARMISYILIGYLWFSQGQWWSVEPVLRPFSPEFAVLLSIIIVVVSEGITKSSPSGEDKE